LAVQVDAGELKFENLASTELVASLSETTKGVVNRREARRRRR
jgi:hypothetical protein